MSILQNSNAISAGGYDINNSLRFRSSASAYLNRTFTTPTNNKIWTYSTWIKRGSLTTTQVLLATSSEELRYIADGGASGVVDSFQYNAGAGYGFRTNATYRDVSAWYHILVAVDTTQATAANRARIYINGVEASTDGTYNISQNTNTQINSAVAHNIARRTSGSLYFDGYQAETYFVDGQQLTPSSFGETDTITGVWKPKAYSGTYGTNGFYLKFSDIATTSGSNAGLGKDFSGNTNYWTTNNISVTSGTTYDAMTDSPTNTSATVANYATLNPVNQSSNLATTGGNLNVTSSTTAWYPTSSTISIPTSGKWYCEFIINAIGNSPFIGIWKVSDFNFNSTTVIGYSATSYSFNTYDGNKANNSSSVSYGSSLTNGDVLNIAVDMDSGKIWWGKNGTWFASGVPASGTNAAYSGLSGEYYFSASIYSGISVSANFGQRPFAYTPPTGFNRLNTYNLPDSTIKKGNSYMDATLYTGTGSALTVTNTASFKPDFVWIKKRATGTANHALYDSVRGVRKTLSSSATDAEVSEPTGYSLTAFNSNGFSVAIDNTGVGSVNGNTYTYVGWQWQAGQGTTSSNTSGSITSTVSVNTTAGFSIVTYTGTGANATVGHGLGVAPKMVIIKNRSSGSLNWGVYNATVGNTKVLLFNTTAAASAADPSFWNNTSPTSTTFSLGTWPEVNNSGNSFVAYCWAEIAGFSKFGSYTGNGSTDGPFIYTGFRPKYVMTKLTSAAGQDWAIKDTSRNTYNASSNTLLANLFDAEYSANGDIDIISNGFKIRTTNGNQNNSGATYIYIAFAENPFKNANAR